VQGHVRSASASEASDAELDDEGLARACDVRLVDWFFFLASTSALTG
jgi:hypothetical protein